MNATEMNIKRITEQIYNRVTDGTPIIKISSCDYANWDIEEHYALMALHRNPPSALILTYSINFGVYDWVIAKANQ